MYIFELSINLTIPRFDLEIKRYFCGTFRRHWDSCCHLSIKYAYKCKVYMYIYTKRIRRVRKGYFLCVHIYIYIVHIHTYTYTYIYTKNMKTLLWLFDQTN